jgi:hypothetical protein
MMQALGDSFHIPSLSEYLEPLDYELDPANDIEKDYRQSNNPSFVWKALRLTARYELDLFNKIGHADVEKLYYHLYPEKKVQMECEESIDKAHESNKPHKQKRDLDNK